MTGPADTRTRVEKLRAMASQDVSPRERDIALAKLAELSETQPDDWRALIEAFSRARRALPVRRAASPTAGMTTAQRLARLRGMSAARA